MRCSKCGCENPADNNFCAQCGNALARLCGKCGAEYSLASNFCGKCGASLAKRDSSGNGISAVRKSAIDIRVVENEAEASAPAGERKTVTALFADIKGSTELMEDLDPEEARAIIDPALKLMIDAVQRYDGHVVQSTGDGIFALFGAPIAHEDHPQRALYAALRIQEELKRYSDRIRQKGQLPLQARVGANTGEVVVRLIQTGAAQTEYTPIGHTANLASRMQALAPIGSIAVTETTRGLCEGYFILTSLGPTRVKGLSEPVNVYEVAGMGPLRTRLQRAVGRGLTKFVGREREMEALKHAAEVARQGHGQIVAAMAEPGVGKSRLYFEFKATSQSGWMVLETFSISHGKASAYLPVLDLLHGYFKIAGEDDQRTRREKLTGRILALDRSLEDTLPYLFSLLSIVEGADPLAQMDGLLKKRRTLEAIKRILLRESLNQPLIVLFEDLHWIDEQTQELLNLIADSIGTAKILLLVNYRPEYSHQWNSKTYYTQLRLDPLGNESAEAMLTALLGDSAELTLLKRLITEKTEGNPFFIEEMVQTLFEEGALARNGEIKLRRQLSEIPIPTTVQAILTSRIDRLPQNEKDLLQTLAVIGREFPLALVERLIAVADDELNRRLSDLQLREFIYEQPAAGGNEYIFKHALTQEMAYKSILAERRTRIHEQTAQAIEALFATSLPDHYPELARHYERSGNVPKAVGYLHLAAQQTMNRNAHQEAADQLAAALELLRSQTDDLERDRTEIAIRFSLALCLGIGIGDIKASTNVLEKALRLSEKLSDDATLFEVLSLLAFTYSVQLDHQKASGLFKGALEIAMLRRDSEMIGHIRCWLGYSYLYEGNFTAAIGELEQADELSGIIPKEGFRLYDWRIQSRAFASYTYLALGYPERATAKSKESLKVANEIKASPRDLVSALWWSAALNLQLGNCDVAYQDSAEAARLADQYGMLVLLATIDLLRGWTLAQKGKLDAGLSILAKCRPEVIPITSAWLFMGLAEVCLSAGRLDEGLEAAAAGLDLAESTGTRVLEAETRRLKGELLSKRDVSEISQADRCFRDAVETARKQGAKSFELRATMSLARLLSTQDRREEARAMLSEIYDWFTEGFDTVDLKNAKALLDELAA
jgi:class 3 adenylate cyclase/tetratricopeptide (TPR) repeat protein